MWNQTRPEEIGGAIIHLMVCEASKKPDHDEQQFKFRFGVVPIHMHVNAALPHREAEMAIALRQLVANAMI